MSSSLITFEDTPLSEYVSHFAAVFDNVFTPEECSSLLSLAKDKFQPTGPKDSSVRHTVRLDAPTEADFLYERLRPLLDEIAVIAPKDPWAGIIGKRRTGGPTWIMQSLNPKLSFLRYTPGDYCKAHRDGSHFSPDGTRKSYLTMHLYLTGGAATSTSTATPFPEDASGDIVGGATRFLPSSENEQAFVDVEPVLGRVLIFQQRKLRHSGLPVVHGVKYSLRTDFMYSYAEGGRIQK